MAQKIKLSTIGEALGVSTATVSLALRDSPLVAEATKEKIKAHARQMGYIYNRRAASLRTSKSGIIGVVVHDIMNPFYGEILKSIETELDRSRHTFLLSNHYDNVEKQRDFLDTLMQLGADGVIMSPAIGTPLDDVDLILRNGLPVVLIARSIPRASLPVFRGDDAFGTGLATKHLISLGHKRIAFIGGTDETSTGRDRYQGYLAAMQNIDRSIYEAARIDGANPWQLFRHVTLPLLNPVMVFAIVITTIYSLQLFDQIVNINFTDQGGPLNRTLSLALYMYEEAFGRARMGYAAAVTVVLFGIIMIVTLIQLRLTQRRVDY